MGNQIDAEIAVPAGPGQSEVRRLERRRWVIWVAVAIAFLAAYFHRTVTGVVADFLMRDFAIERASELGILASIYFYTYAVLQIPAGILADFYGPRRTVSLAMLLAACGAALFGWADTLHGLYAGRFLASFGVALIYVNIVKIHAEWFRLREFGTMSGMTVLVGNVGSLVAATPLAFLVDSLGWRPSFYIIAGYSLATAVLCWLLVRNRPADVGLPSIAEIENCEGHKGLQQAPPPTQDGVAACMRAVVENRHTWSPFFVSVAVYGVYMAIIGVWGVPYFMQVYGMSRIAASNHVMVMAVGNMIGGPLIGILSDRLGFRRWPYTCATAFFLAVLSALTAWNGARPPEWTLYPFCLAIGLGMSGITLTVACVKEVNPPNTTGIAAGIANSGPFIGGALMQPAFGWVLDRHWQGVVEQGVKIYPAFAYQNAFSLCVAVLAAGLVLTFWIKETRCNMIGTVDGGLKGTFHRPRG